MAKPKFSFEAGAEPPNDAWELILRVENGGKQTRWKINYRTTNEQLGNFFYEIADALHPMMVEPAPKLRTAPERPQQSPDEPEDTQMSEEGSAELRAAKAKSVDKTGKAWFSNMSEEGELPLYTIGHGDEG